MSSKRRRRNKGGPVTKSAGNDALVTDWRRDVGWKTLDGLLGLQGVDRIISFHEALRLSAFMACLDVVSQDIAKTPIHMYRRVGSGKERVYDHPVARLLALNPNERQTRSEFFAQLVLNLKTWGSGYIIEEQSSTGKLLGLHVAPSARVTIHRTPNDNLAYWLSPAGEVEEVMLQDVARRLPERVVIHIRQRAFDGLSGMGALSIGQRHLGLSAKLLAYRERLYGNNGAINGVFSRDSDKAISEEGWKRLKQELRTEFEAFKQGLRPLVLDDGLTYKTDDMNATDTQTSDGLQRELADVARLFRLPPHKIGALESVKYDNMETMERSYISNTLEPTFVDIELAFQSRLLTDDEQRDHFFEFDRESLQSVDYKTRAEKTAQLFESGVISRNEARDRLGLNPDAQDMRLVRGNQAVVNADGSVTYPGRGDSKEGGDA